MYLDPTHVLAFSPNERVAMLGANSEKLSCNLDKSSEFGFNVSTAVMELAKFHLTKEYQTCCSTK